MNTTFTYTSVTDPKKANVALKNSSKMEVVMSYLGTGTKNIAGYNLY